MGTSSFSSRGVSTLLYASAVALKGVFTGLSVGYPGPKADYKQHECVVVRAYYFTIPRGNLRHYIYM